MIPLWWWFLDPPHKWDLQLSDPPQNKVPKLNDPLHRFIRPPAPIVNGMSLSWDACKEVFFPESTPKPGSSRVQPSICQNILDQTVKKDMNFP